MTRVLVVDDEANIADLVSLALRYEGFDVEIAASGQAAVDAVERRPPDLILLDIMLGDIDGFEVARRLTGTGCPPWGRDHDMPGLHQGPLIFHP